MSAPGRAYIARLQTAGTPLATPSPPPPPIPFVSPAPRLSHPSSIGSTQRGKQHLEHFLSGESWRFYRSGSHRRASSEHTVAIKAMVDVHQPLSEDDAFVGGAGMDIRFDSLSDADVMEHQCLFTSNAELKFVQSGEDCVWIGLDEAGIGATSCSTAAPAPLALDINEGHATDVSDASDVSDAESEKTECGTPVADCVQLKTILSTKTSEQPKAASAMIKLETTACKRGKKRPATDTNVDADDDDEKRSLKLVELLSDPNFDPGPRPERIDGTSITPGMMFKEHPKRRREHSSAARKMDKWYNTGGIKSASDRFDNATGLGLRKRYGKIVRDGLPVLRFHEYKLLTRQGQTVTETKDGPTLFRMVPETKRRREMGSVLTVVKTQQAELQRLRRNQQVLSRQLRRAQQTVSDQGAEIERLQRELQQRRAGIATASLTQDAQDCGSN